MNEGGNDIVVFKLDTNGDQQWVKQLPSFNTNLNDFFPDITVDRSGNVYVSYYTAGGDVGGEDNINEGGNDIVVFKLDTNGDQQWVEQLASFNTNKDDLSPSITVDSSGNIYVSYFTVDGDVGGKDNQNEGGNDIVVFKLTQGISSSELSNIIKNLVNLSAEDAIIIKKSYTTKKKLYNIISGISID